jgi:hypothetical protein
VSEGLRIEFGGIFTVADIVSIEEAKVRVEAKNE